MSTYDHFTFNEDGSEYFIRETDGLDGSIASVTRFTFSPADNGGYAPAGTGTVNVAEFDGVDADGTVGPQIRETKYRTGPSNVVGLTLRPPYDIQNSVLLDDSANVETYGDLNDYIEAQGGDDVIDAGNGRNLVHGGKGNDLLTSGNQADLDYGDAGQDTIRSGAKNDWVFGGKDDDAIYGQGGNDVLMGDAGNDYINGGTGDDIVYDVFGDNRVYAGDGEDFIITGSGNDYIKGDAGNDIIQSGGGNDKIYGGDGDDNIQAGAGADTVRGDIGNDVIDGGLGNDILYGGDGNDILNGFGDSDTLYGEAGDDTLYADGSSTAVGDDNLWGGTGNDTLWGGNGTDHLYGEADDDILVGTAQGKAIMRGGDGHDTFAFTGANAFGAMHVVYDFGADDVVNVSDMLTGFTASSNIDDFVRLSVVDSTRANILINADGMGTGFKSLVALMGDYTGQTVDSLAASGRLVANTPLFASDN